VATKRRNKMGALVFTAAFFVALPILALIADYIVRNK